MGDTQVKVRCQEKGLTKETYVEQLRTFYEKIFDFSEEALKEIMRLRTRNLDLWGTIDALYKPAHLEFASEATEKKNVE